MKEDGSFQEFPAYVEKSSGKSRIILVFIVIIAIILAILVAFYVLGIKNNKTTSFTPSPAVETPTPTVTAIPSESISSEPLTGKITPKPSRVPSVAPAKTTLDRSKLSIAVLNGSGTPGAAKEISSSLNSLGYTISTVANADNFTYQNITVKIKKSKSDYLSILKKDISVSSPNIPITTSTDNTISTDAQVIIGK